MESCKQTNPNLELISCENLIRCSHLEKNSTFIYLRNQLFRSVSSENSTSSFHTCLVSLLNEVVFTKDEGMQLKLLDKVEKWYKMHRNVTALPHNNISHSTEVGKYAILKEREKQTKKETINTKLKTFKPSFIAKRRSLVPNNWFQDKVRLNLTQQFAPIAKFHKETKNASLPPLETPNNKNSSGFVPLGVLRSKTERLRYYYKDLIETPSKTKKQKINSLSVYDSSFQPLSTKIPQVREPFSNEMQDTFKLKSTLAKNGIYMPLDKISISLVSSDGAVSSRFPKGNERLLSMT